jgi:hypothetical protein
LSYKEIIGKLGISKLLYYKIMSSDEEEEKEKKPLKIK